LDWQLCHGWYLLAEDAPRWAQMAFTASRSSKVSLISLVDTKVTVTGFTSLFSSWITLRYKTASWVAWKSAKVHIGVLHQFLLDTVLESGNEEFCLDVL
jgi:hypothetical protein